MDKVRPENQSEHTPVIVTLSGGNSEGLEMWSGLFLFLSDNPLRYASKYPDSE